MSATPHHGSQRRQHGPHHTPRNKSVIANGDSEDEEEMFRLFKASRAAKRSAEMFISLLREAENDTAEKIATRTAAGGLAADGGEGVPADAGSPSATALGAPILPTVETGEKSSLEGAASVVTNIAKTPAWMPTLPSTSFGSSSMSDKSYSVITEKSSTSSKSKKSQKSCWTGLRSPSDHLQKSADHDRFPMACFRQLGLIRLSRAL